MVVSADDLHLYLGQEVLQHVVQHIRVLHLFPATHANDLLSLLTTTCWFNRHNDDIQDYFYPLSLFVGFQPVSPGRNRGL